ncbi:MAG: two pore domain potassium channel family protein, partial [Nitrospira sp.]|nr:two pore domain potassium channel family protein [Nitrospira sp.]
MNRRPFLSLRQSLALRAVVVVALFAVALIGHWLDRKGLKDAADGHVSFIDVTYFTAITVTTVGYGDIVPVTDRARLFDTFVVTPIRIFVWLIFLGTAYTLFLRQISDRARSIMAATKLKQHIVMCGFGASGESVVHDLLQQGRPPSQIGRDRHVAGTLGDR